MALVTIAGALLMAQAPGPIADVAYEELADGRNEAAIARIAMDDAIARDDPALLINLGVAYARRGNVEMAKELFEAATRSENRVDLETSTGAWVDSKTLAKRALRMLARNEFRDGSRMTMR